MLCDDEFSGIDFIQVYIKTEDIIGFCDLALRWKCDAPLKIAYALHNKNVKMYMHHGAIGVNRYGAETIECYNIKYFKTNLDKYINYFNKIFFLKNEIHNLEQDDEWLLFTDRDASCENGRIISNDNIRKLGRNIIYAICNYEKRLLGDMKFSIGMLSFNYNIKYFADIKTKSIELDEIDADKISIDYLIEYNANNFDKTDNNVAAKRYVEENPSSNQGEKKFLAFKLRHEFGQTNKQIACLLSDDKGIDIDDLTLQKRAQRLLKDSNKYFSQ